MSESMPPLPPEPPQDVPGPAPLKVNLTSDMTEDQVLEIGAHLKAMTETEGWQILVQLAQKVRTGLAFRGYTDQARSRDYYAGILDAWNLYLMGPDQILEQAEEIRKERTEEAEEGKKVLPGPWENAAADEGEDLA